MQAVVLVGGRGERLHPLTLTTPKPLIPLANRPLIEHIVRWLERMGAVEALLLTHYRAAAFDRWLKRWQGIPVRAVEEPIPLGTAGAVANVAHSLWGTTAVINGDNLTNLDLRAMTRAHRATGAVVTIAVDAVADVTGRGVVVMDAGGRVARFQEKPAPGAALAATVNTGSYLVEPAALKDIPPGQPAMWESDLFPHLIAAGAPVYGFATPHLWLDAGTPAGYFEAQRRMLQGALSAPPGIETNGVWAAANTFCDAGAAYTAPIAIGFGAIIAAGARLHGPLSVGAECHILPGAHVAQSALWDGCLVERGAIIERSIIGYNCYIGADARVDGALLGDGAVVRPGAYVRPGSRILPATVVA